MISQCRKPLLDWAGVPQHPIQLGNNRQQRFFNEPDYHCYLAHLRAIKLPEGCRVHAYVLLTDHRHLLATPAEASQIEHMVQSLRRRYVRYIADRYHPELKRLGVNLTTFFVARSPFSMGE